jgi:hypothetical protein
LKKNGSGMVVLGVDPGSMEMVDDAESYRDQGEPQYPLTRIERLSSENQRNCSRDLALTFDERVEKLLRAETLHPNPRAL